MSDAVLVLTPMCLGVSCLLLVTVCAVAWRAFGRCGLRRRLAYASCAASQLAVVIAAALLWGGGVIAPAWAIAVALCGMACAVYDVALVRSLVTGERAADEHERVLALAEQLEAQQAYEAERRSFTRESQASYALAIEQLERIARVLEGQDEQAAASIAIQSQTAGESSVGDGLWCANEAINAMLAFKERTVRMYGGRLDAQVVLPYRVGVPDVELCALISNIIDAALPALTHGGDVLRVQLYCAHGYFCLAVDAAAREVVLPSQHPLRVLRAYAARREGDVRSAWEAGALRLSVLVPRADSCLRSQK